MDSIINSKIDKQTIYDIYRACRLCGAGAGYKMPIIQNVVDLDANGIELKQKIRDCVQIEVSSDDKMPPLICELCVDKVNDFYEFLEMCQLTNKRTRARLGLPPQSTGKVRNANYDSGDCILGVTEPVYANDDSDEPLSASRRPKAEPKVKIKIEKTETTRDSKDSQSRLDNSRDRSRPDRTRPERSRPDNTQSKTRSESSRESKKSEGREARSRLTSGRDSSEAQPGRFTRLRRQPTPPRVTRHSKSSLEENISLSSLRQQTKRLSSPSPKSILKKDTKSEDVRSKRSKEPPKPEVPQKKVKLSEPARTHACPICARCHVTSQALSSHMRTHNVAYTPHKLACNACGEWFPSGEQAAAHHRAHRDQRRPYRCRRCAGSYKLQQGYDDHISNGECVPWEETPDVECAECWRKYPTETLLRAHRCGGADSRPGGKCMKCKRTYALLKNLKKHQDTCNVRRKSNLVVNPEVMERIRPVWVRLARCDELLTPAGDHYNVSGIGQGFGTDPRCVYPYAPDLMVSIKGELPDLDDDALHWGGGGGGADPARTVESLITLSLKTIFSDKLLGKVPRKRRRLKTEKNGFDSLLNAGEFDNDFKMNIDNIIDNLGNDDDDLADFDKKASEANDNDSVNSESLLCNDGTINNSNDFAKHNHDDEFNDNSNSQSLFIASNIGNYDEQINESRLSSFNTLKDKGASTDCETEMEDVKDSEGKLKDDRLSSDVNDKSYAVKDNCVQERENNYFDNASTNSDLDNDDEFRKSINDENSHHINEDRQMNGELDEISKKNDDLNDSDEDKKLMDALDEQIGEDNDQNSQSNDNNTESKLTHDETIENHKEMLVNEENVRVNERIAENNDKMVEERLSEINGASIDNDIGDHSTRNHQDENEAICNDIQDKINDLIAQRSTSENNNWNTTNETNVTENGDKLVSSSVINDNVREKIVEDSLNQNTVAGNNDSFNETNVNFTHDNDCDKEKIALEDLLPAKGYDTKSMDLDSISDEEFNFDA